MAEVSRAQGLLMGRLADVGMALRDDASGPMQVVSGPIGRLRVHFQAPPAGRLEAEASRFLEWLNDIPDEPLLIRAGLGHLWFITLHPFDDGNGRIARANGDLLLARASGSWQACIVPSIRLRTDSSAGVASLTGRRNRAGPDTNTSAHGADHLV